MQQISFTTNSFQIFSLKMYFLACARNEIPESQSHNFVIVILVCLLRMLDVIKTSNIGLGCIYLLQIVTAKVDCELDVFMISSIMLHHT